MSRERAQAIILEGRVRVNGIVQRSVAFAVPPAAALDIKDDTRYVGRGGLKLERALAAFEWQIDGLRCLDVGASTGGFTDCLLRHGASSVAAVDVGYGHFAWKLRQDPRVAVFERTNFRTVDVQSLGAPFDLATIDVSFISLAKVATPLRAALVKGGKLVALVKPQFEAGRGTLERGGVVRDRNVHMRVLQDVISALRAAGLQCLHIAHSPLKGPAGNIEFLLGAIADASEAPRLDVAGVVERAHEALDP